MSDLKNEVKKVIVTAILSTILGLLCTNGWNLATGVFQQRANAENLFDGLSQTAIANLYTVTSSDVSAGSVAAKYADVVTRIVKASYDAENASYGDTLHDVANGSSKESSVLPFSEPKIDFCYPRLDTLPSKCMTIDHFTFDAKNKVSSFSMNGTPVSNLVLSYRFDENQAMGDSHLKAAYGGAIIDPDFQHATNALVLSASDQNRQQNIFLDTNSITLYNKKVQKVEGAYAIPAVVPNYSHVTAAIRMNTAGEGFVMFASKLHKFNDENVKTYADIKDSAKLENWINLNWSQW